ncbi:hypothetical protein VNI00_000680 [Paramarasmius palmivorus]|uniref:Uncharacterized protein n=1 Tax=Paramarasmius palmivorus TaxID=297713 RepID=A0AAW0E631_9AGAR
MGRALFSQSYTQPAIASPNACHAPLNPSQPKPECPYERWSISNPFDPDSEEFFEDAQVERFIDTSQPLAPPEPQTETRDEIQVLISSSIPPRDSVEVPPGDGEAVAVSGWTSVGDESGMWRRTIRRTVPVRVTSPTNLPLSNPESEASTPRSSSPQTPLESDVVLPGLPPPATTITMSPTTPSLMAMGTPRRRLTNSQGETFEPSPPLSVSPRSYGWRGSSNHSNPSSPDERSRSPIRPAMMSTGSRAPLPRQHSEQDAEQDRERQSSRALSQRIQRSLNELEAIYQARSNNSRSLDRALQSEGVPPRTREAIDLVRLLLDHSASVRRLGQEMGSLENDFAGLLERLRSRNPTQTETLRAPEPGPEPDPEVVRLRLDRSAEQFVAL